MENDELFDCNSENINGISVGGVVETHIQPDAKVIVGKIAFEPMLGGVRISARDNSNRTLWGFVASKKMIGQHHCPVGIHVTLKELIREELKNHNLSYTNDNQIESAIQEIKTLNSKLEKSLQSLDIKKPSEATFKKAKAIYKAVHDANILIDIETDNLNK